jgi:hypothetical protein
MRKSMKQFVFVQTFLVFHGIEEKEFSAKTGERFEGALG